MRNIKLLFAGYVAVLLVSGCGISNDGFSNSSIQKRKYTKGFYFSKNKSWAKEDGEKSTELKTDEILPSDERAVVFDEREVLTNENTPNAEMNQQQPTPSAKKNEKNDQTTDQKSEQKKESGNKKAAPAEKKSSGSSATQRSRKERVPERYLPFKKDAIENKLENQSSSADDFLILCVILTILIPPLGVAVYTNIDWTKTLICLLLTILFYIPGLIYGLLVVFDKI